MKNRISKIGLLAFVVFPFAVGAEAVSLKVYPLQVDAAAQVDGAGFRWELNPDPSPDAKKALYGGRLRPEVRQEIYVVARAEDGSGFPVRGLEPEQWRFFLDGAQVPLQAEDGPTFSVRMVTADPRPVETALLLNAAPAQVDALQGEIPSLLQKFAEDMTSAGDAILTRGAVYGHGGHQMIQEAPGDPEELMSALSTVESVSTYTLENLEIQWEPWQWEEALRQLLLTNGSYAERSALLWLTDGSELAALTPERAVSVFREVYMEMPSAANRVVWLVPITGASGVVEQEAIDRFRTLWEGAGGVEDAVLRVPPPGELPLISDYREFLATEVEFHLISTDKTSPIMDGSERRVEIRLITSGNAADVLSTGPLSFFSLRAKRIPGWLWGMTGAGLVLVIGVTLFLIQLLHVSQKPAEEDDLLGMDASEDILEEVQADLSVSRSRYRKLEEGIWEGPDGNLVLSELPPDLEEGLEPDIG